MSAEVPIVKARQIIKGLEPQELRRMAAPKEITTNFGAPNYIHRHRARSAPLTRCNVDGQWGPGDNDAKTIENVYKLLQSLTLLQVDLQMCKGSPRYHVRLYIPRHFAELGYFAAQSMYPAPPEWIDRPVADMTTIMLPDWANLATQTADRCILVDAERFVTYVLGTDYYGEVKKSFLRMTMYKAKLEGRLGLHAGSKEVWAKSRKTGQINKCGLIFFGLSGTGKTSLTCHHFEMDEAAGERVRVLQDDVVLLDKKGFIQGTEGKGFFVKTEDLSPDDQAAIYEACTSEDAVLENVWVNPDGSVDFFNDIISKNGRAIVQISRVRNTDGEIDMEKCTHVFFITRNDFMPRVAKLTPEQAAVAFMLGESIKTSAADVHAKDEAVREVGTNPFIIGPKDEEGNIFYDLLKSNPEIECYILNTGKVGRGPRAQNVTLNDTVTIIREICREGIEWIKSPVYDFLIPESVPGTDTERFRLVNCYEPDELKEGMARLRTEREQWLDQFPRLRPEIRQAVY